MQTWEVVAGDRVVAITATAAPNGKLMVRAGGRMPTPPIALEEQEREFDVEGWRFRIVRDGETLRLDELGPVEWPAFEAPPAEKTKGGAFQTATIVVALVVAVLCFAIHASLPRLHAPPDQEMVQQFAGILGMVRFAIRVVAGGSLLLAGVVFFRPADVAPRLAAVGGWVLVVLVAITLYAADVSFHDFLSRYKIETDAMRLSGIHTSGVLLLLASAVVSGMSQSAVSAS